jgi:hypothetical protein
MEWPGTAPPDVLLKWTSAAPVKKTPLGPHTIAIRAKRIGAPDTEPPLLAFDGPLSDLVTTQPATGSAAWRIDSTKPSQYRAILRRADINDSIQVSIRITDPLGRASEALATVNPGSILPDPVLSNFVQKKSLAPPGVTIGWASDTPLDPPVYSITVTVSQPPKKIGNIFVRQPNITQTLPLASVPLDEPGPVPPGVDPLRVRRMPGPGPKFNYYAFIRVPFTQVLVKLSAPDGRSTQHIEVPL